MRLLNHTIPADETPTPEPSMSPETLAVEIVCTSGPVPFVAAGRARAEGDDWVVHLATDASHLAAGSHAILSFEDQAQPRIIGRIQSVKGNRIVLEERIVRERERRAFPRLVGGLRIEARALDDREVTAESAAWMRGDAGPQTRGDWFRPDELMNFSVTGLRMEAPEGVTGGQVLLLSVGIKEAGPWRCTARVVRTFAPPIDGDPSDRQVAIEFIEIPEEAEGALADLTLQIQDQMLQ